MRFNLVCFCLFSSILLNGCGGSSNGGDGQGLTSYRPTVIEYDVNNDGEVDYQDIYTYDEEGKLLSINGNGSTPPPSDAFSQYQVFTFFGANDAFDPSLIVGELGSLDQFSSIVEEGSYTSSIDYSYDDQGRVTDINTEIFQAELSIARNEYSVTWSEERQAIAIIFSCVGFDGSLITSGTSDIIYSDGLIVESPAGVFSGGRTQFPVYDIEGQRVNGLDTQEFLVLSAGGPVFRFEGSIQYDYDEQSRLTNVTRDQISGPSSIVIDYTDENRVFSITESTSIERRDISGFLSEGVLSSVDYYFYDDIGLLTSIETDRYIDDSPDFEVDSIQTIQWEEGECAESLVWFGDELPSFFPRDIPSAVRGDGHTYANPFCTRL